MQVAGGICRQSDIQLLLKVHAAIIWHSVLCNEWYCMLPSMASVSTKMTDSINPSQMGSCLGNGHRFLIPGKRKGLVFMVVSTRKNSQTRREMVMPAMHLKCSGGDGWSRVRGALSVGTRHVFASNSSTQTLILSVK